MDSSSLLCSEVYFRVNFSISRYPTFITRLYSFGCNVFTSLGFSCSRPSGCRIRDNRTHSSSSSNQLPPMTLAPPTPTPRSPSPLPAAAALVTVWSLHSIPMAFVYFPPMKIDSNHMTTKALTPTSEHNSERSLRSEATHITHEDTKFHVNLPSWGRYGKLVSNTCLKELEVSLGQL